MKCYVTDTTRMSSKTRTADTRQGDAADSIAVARSERCSCRPYRGDVMIEERQNLVPVRGLLVLVALLLALTAAAVAESKCVPPEVVDEQKIFWGTASKFEKPGSVDYFALVSATEDYKTAQKAEKDSARYWIHINKANEQAVKAIGDVGSETDYDLIVWKGYLESLSPPIPAEDITGLALAKLTK